MQTFLESSLYARHCLKPHVFSFNAQCALGGRCTPTIRGLPKTPQLERLHQHVEPGSFFRPAQRPPCCLESKGRCHDPITWWGRGAEVFLLEFVPLSMA